jgi:hypothetical protein
MRSDKNNPLRQSILGIAANILIISLLVLLINGRNPTDNNDGDALANPEPFIELDPNLYSWLPLNSAQSALTEANIQLSLMYIGNIQTIDTQEYTAFLIQDFQKGGIIYWDLDDSSETVCIRADTKEIISYSSLGYYPGTMSEGQIITQATLIAGQFATLPSDRENPSVNRDVTYSDEAFEGDTNTSSVTDVECWFFEFVRSKETVLSEDEIQMKLSLNGYLHSYDKTWNMELDTLQILYPVTQEEAESIALAEAGENSVVQDTFQRIVRPNNIWTLGEFAYGLDAVCVWEIWVEDFEQNLRVYHIDGALAEIVGGDFAEYWYYVE